MAIQIKNSFIAEDIEDENGNKIGEIKFNPEDARIMEKLSKIINDLVDSKKKFDSLGNIDENAFKKEVLTSEDFEKYSETYQKFHDGFKIEYNYNESIIKDLSEIFGEETINLFTKGSSDADTLMPLIEYIAPIVQERRSKKVNKYLKKNKQSDVME